MSHAAPPPMTPERWSQVKNLLERALSRPRHEREEYLRHAAGDDQDLYEEVAHLVAAHDADPAFLDKHPETAPLAPIHDRRLGTTLKGRYRIKSRLGSGGVGVVYLAEDLNLMSRLVVVKFLHEHGGRQPGRLIKFLQEAEALARLDHPGIVAAFDADETPDGSHFLVMQYVDGRTLRALIEEGPAPLELAGSILRQLGSALEVAHNKGVIHRDLKPENIMLQKLGDDRQIVKLIDFGVARVEASAVSTDTAVIGIAGTPSYMAPEHLSGKPVPASDTFSLAVIAFEMLTGKRPFTAKQPFALRQQHRQGLPKGAIRNLRPEVPVEAENAIRQALLYEAAERPQNSRVFCDTAGIALERSRPVPKPHSASRRWILYSSAAGVAAAAAGAAFWRSSRSVDVPRVAGKILAQHEGAFDPGERGFTARDKIEFTPVRNPERTGFDALSLRSKEQGLYARRLAVEDLRQALQQGWRITLRGRPVIGGMWACADFRALGEPRYDLSFYREPDGRAVALLCTQHVPTFEGPRYELPDEGANRHRLELVYDPATRSCELFVDGRRQIAGYKGHRQMQAKEPLDAFFFGISVYRSDRAEA
ncbi:MAG TPA: serine/threonine-protein kinase, partial [Bryobacteraceae bacterium]|nr:serine/threonine-protein kinase [Bryobacteraceae bacterium]